MCCLKKKIEMFRHRRDVIKSIAIFYFGVGLISSSSYAVINLQSSLNIEGGLGVTSMSLFSVSMLISGLVLAPVLAKFTSVRFLFITGGILLLSLTVSNLYPAYYTMIPGSILTGTGRGLFWISSAMYSVFYAKAFADTGTGNFKGYFSKINGCFFAVVSSGQIFGNLIPFLLLEIPDSAESGKLQSKAFNRSDDFNISVTDFPLQYTTQDMCGANDCQDPTIIKEDSSNYRPPSQEILYLLFGVLIGIHLMGITLHILFAPLFTEIVPSTLCNLCSKGVENIAYVQDNNNKSNDDTNDIKTCSTTSERNNNKEQRTKSNSKNISVHEKEKCEVKIQFSQQKSNNKIDICIEQLKSTLRCFLHPQQFLLAGIEIHTGINLSFVSSEFTRAFISCVYGVGQVGISMVVYGASVMFFAFATGKISAKYGRKACVGFGCLTNLGVYVICLIWVGEDTTNVLPTYALLFALGICDAIFPAITTEASIIHYPRDSRAAYSCCLTWSSVGCFVQYAWSTSVCVRYKLYVMIFVLLFGVLTYAVAENRNSKNNQRKQQGKRIVNAIA